MRPDPRVLLADADRAGADIESFVEGMSRETFVGDGRTAAVIPDRVWDFAENDLPLLREQVQELLGELGPPGA